MQPLADLAKRGQQPRFGQIWIGLGFRLPKRNAINIDPTDLPTDVECAALAGLDVILVYPGNTTGYAVLRRICGSIYAARPRRLMIVDSDFKKFAFLRVANK